MPARDPAVRRHARLAPRVGNPALARAFDSNHLISAWILPNSGWHRSGRLTPRPMSPAATPGVPHPFADARFEALDATMKRHRFQPDSLLEVLHTAQELFGYLDTRCLTYVGRCLKLPPSRVYGVATFYHFFSLKPAGDHTCVVCTGTACYVKGASAILSAVEKALGVSPGETTADGKASLVITSCLGACGMAPALVFDNDVAGKLTPPLVLARLAGWSGHER